MNTKESIEKEKSLTERLRLYSSTSSGIELHPVCVEAADEIERLESIIDFVREKCVCRNAGSLQQSFAYLWKRDWDKFEEMVEK